MSSLHIPSDTLRDTATIQEWEKKADLITSQRTISANNSGVGEIAVSHTLACFARLENDKDEVK